MPDDQTKSCREIWIATRIGPQLIHRQTDDAVNRESRNCVISRVALKPKYGG